MGSFSYILIQERVPVKHGLRHLYKYNTHHVQYITNIDFFFLVSYTKPISVKVEYALWRSLSGKQRFLARQKISVFESSHSRGFFFFLAGNLWVVIRRWGRKNCLICLGDNTMITAFPLLQIKAGTWLRNCVGLHTGIWTWCANWSPHQSQLH